MKKILFSLTAVAALFGMMACSSNDDVVKDTQLPTITDQGITANPVDCQVYNRGDVIPFCYRFTDNEELGNYNIEIHNNFDHHTHGTQGKSCDPDETERNTKNAFYYNQDFSIPRGSKAYDASQEIQIPATVEPGDYHFVIRVTDQTGNQQLRAMAMKIK